jgi:hypothetical protein
MAVIDHGDGLLSIYARLGQLNGIIPVQLNNSSIIAKSGVSGWSLTGGYYFMIFDKKERRWVNPSLVIPSPPDTRQPVIQSVRLKDDEGQEFDLANVRTIRQGRYTIIVNARDIRLGTSEPPLMPRRIICSVNGIETGFLAFETFSARDGVLLTFRNGLVPVSQIYSPAPSVEAGEAWLTRGQATLEIIVQDASGNARNATYRLFIE